MRSPRIAIAQIQPRKADYAENLRRIGAVLAQVGGWNRPPDVVVFPETATSGYFLEGGVREVAVSTERLLSDLVQLHRGAKIPPVDVVVGFYE